MTRRVFFSFYYDVDSWRASQVRNMGVVEKNPRASDNDWETITDGGDAAIEQWIDEQMDDRTCVIVLVGAHTAGRKWINYEIAKAWEDGKGLFGIYIHGLENDDGDQASRGADPFEDVMFTDGAPLSTRVKIYDTPYTTSTYVYDHIKENLADWVEAAIAARA